MIGGFNTVILAWVNKNALFGYTWLFVYQRPRSYEGLMNGGPILCKGELHVRRIAMKA